MKLKNLLALALTVGLVGAAGCKNDNSNEGTEGSDGSLVKIDGSSTVFPINQAVAEEFGKKTGARVPIGKSGTGGGFQKFCNKEVDIIGASRPVKTSETKKCKEAGVEMVELPVAYDGITVIVHPDNDWAKSMTTAELKKLWEPSAANTITKWSQVRDGWPDQPIRLFGAGVDSGTFDYFTHAIVGQEQASRGDFTNSEDDHIIVTGVSKDQNALGFLGFAYYDENRERLNAVAIKSPKTDEAIVPSKETISSGAYQPLSRPLFIYVRKDSLENNENVKQFVDYYLTESASVINEVGYVALPEDAYAMARKRADDLVTGSLFEDGSKIGVTVQELLSSERAAQKAQPDGAAPKAKADGKQAGEGTKETDGEAADKQANQEEDSE
jgi:phosphate transport system substrate-binding protein